jgi:hypothetical protein
MTAGDDETYKLVQTCMFHASSSIDIVVHLDGLGTRVRTGPPVLSCLPHSAHWGDDYIYRRHRTCIVPSEGSLDNLPGALLLRQRHIVENRATERTSSGGSLLGLFYGSTGL